MRTTSRSQRRRGERGATLLLTVLLLPALIGFAGLGIGGSVARAAAAEAQRTAELAALAAASSVPTLGRPTSAGLPSIPVDSLSPLPPAVDFPGNVADFTAGRVYERLYNASSVNDRVIGAEARVGALYQGALGSLTSAWTDGCKVGEAQFGVGRARLSRNMAAQSSGGSVVVPKCATAAGTFPSSHERIYVRPEMESTGLYRLQQCMQSPATCPALLGTTATGALTAIGSAAVTNLNTTGVTHSMSCLINPTGSGCAFSASANLFGDASVAAEVQTAVRAQVPGATNLADYAALVTNQGSLTNLGNLLAGMVPAPLGFLLGYGNAPDVCNLTTPLGISGQGLCDPGVDLASALPSTFTPRVRTVVSHNIDIPLVPSWVNGDRPGDISFTGQALARRTFKNAVVVPTLPGSFGATAGGGVTACLPGASLLPGSPGVSLSVLTNTLSLALQATSLSRNCANVEVDSAANVATGNINLNPVVSASQELLLQAAGAMNSQVNRGANTVIANAINAEDGRTRTAADCEANNPPPWCVDIAGQVISDANDLFDPPEAGQAPAMGDILQRAFQTGEPINIISLGKYVKVPIPGGPVSALTYWIPALDVVPAVVTAYDPANPAASTFRVISAATATRGLYRGVLIDHKAARALCTTTPSPDGNCVDQPAFSGTLP